MKNGYEKMTRIQELMQELQRELESLPVYEKELNTNLSELDREMVDILHITENIKMTSAEKDLIVDRTHDLREERREAKYLLNLVTPIFKATDSLAPVLKEKNREISNVLKYTKRGTNYVFRSHNGFDLLNRIIPDYAERTSTNFCAPNLPREIEEKPVTLIPETALAPVEVLAPVKVEIAPPKESDKYYQIVRVCNKWTLRDGLTMVLENTELEEVIEYLYANGWQSVATDNTSKAQLKRDLRELKKELEGDTNRFVHCSRLQQKLF